MTKSLIIYYSDVKVSLHKTTRYPAVKRFASIIVVTCFLKLFPKVINCNLVSRLVERERSCILNNTTLQCEIGFVRPQYVDRIIILPETFRDKIRFSQPYSQSTCQLSYDLVRHGGIRITTRYMERNKLRLKKQAFDPSVHIGLTLGRHAD